MKKEQFLKFYSGNKSAEQCYDLVSEALKEQGILTPLTLIGALATVRVEVGRSFRPIREFSTGRAYEGRADLGNVKSGDGLRYIGRGYIQLTGRFNYKYYGEKLGIDLINNPDLLLDPVNSAKALALYFKDRKVNNACNARMWKYARKLVNGGINGLEEFEKVIKQYLAVYGE